MLFCGGIWLVFININSEVRPCLDAFLGLPREGDEGVEQETAKDNRDAVANLIAILRLTEQINANDETVKKNSNCGECNDGTIVTY